MHANGSETIDLAPVEGEAQQPIGFSAWWMLFVLFLLYVLSLFDRFILTMLVEPIKADLLLSDVQMSIILGPAFAIFYAICGLPLGWAADRYPRRWVIYLGVTFWSVSAMAGGFAKSFVHLLFARIGVGAGEASLTPAAYSLMGDRFPPRRLTTAMSLFQTGSMVGSATAFALGGLMIGFAGDIQASHLPVLGSMEAWQLALVLSGAPGILLALLVFTFSEPPRGAYKKPKAKVDPTDDRFIAFLRREWVLMSLMGVGFASITMIGYSLSSWTPTYIAREFSLTPQQYGPALGAVSMAAGATMVLKGWIVDWLYARGMQDAHLRFYSWLIAAAIPIALLAFNMHSFYSFIVIYALLQVFAIQFVVYLGATLQLVTPEALRARTLAMFLGLFSLLGYGLGPPITAILTDYVYGDESQLGLALLTINIVGLPITLICLRAALKQVPRAMARA